MPDDTWGETVAAFVVLRPELAEDAAYADALPERLTAHVVLPLAAYKRPRRWTVVAALPRNAMGKVRRDLLRDPPPPV